MKKYIKKELELFSFAKEFDGHDDEFEEFLVGDDVFEDFRDVSDFEQFVGDELDRQQLDVLTQLFFSHFE